MDSTSISPIVTPAKPRRRKIWRVALAVLALAIVVPVATWFYLDWQAKRDWEQAVAETDQLDSRWRLLEIEADRPMIPDDENSALHLLAVAKKGKGINLYAMPTFDRIFTKLPTTAQLNKEQESLFRGERTKIAGPLKEARKLKDMPRGRFPITYSDDYFSTLDDLSGNFQSTRNVASWLQYDHYLLAQDSDGQCDEAVELSLGIVNAARTMDGEPAVIPWMIRRSLNHIAVGSLERVLAQGQASEKTLHTMQAAIERESKECQLVTAMRGERAGHHHLFDNIRAGKVTIKPSEIASLSKRPGTAKPASFNDWLIETLPFSMLKYYPEHLRHMNRCVEISKLPIHERGARVTEWEKATSETKNPVIRLLSPRLAKVQQTDCYSQATMRCAYVALACERYRLTHKVWPASLGVLVEKKLLDTIPIDPFDGQPIRYRKTKEGIVLYSFGVDGIDNHGNIDRETDPFQTGKDVGFRLWNVESRRQPPLPPVAIPEGE